jgi:hypothetical protein
MSKKMEARVGIEDAGRRFRQRLALPFFLPHRHLVNGMTAG